MTVSAPQDREIGACPRRFECGNICRPPEVNRYVDVRGMIDRENGMVDRAIFTDRSLYEQVLARVFATGWLFLGHVDQVQKPADFFTTYMCEDPVIVTMDKQKQIRCYLNSC